MYDFAKENEHLLKYFFLLDTDKICDTVNQNLLSDSSIATKFDCIFQAILDNTPQYTNFIFGITNKTHMPFFGKFESNEYFWGLTHLLYCTIRDNCIINSFLSRLHYSDISYELRAKNETAFLMGFYASDKFKNSSILRGQTNSAIYYNRYLRFQKDASLYPYILLTPLKRTKSFLNVPGYLASFYNFLLCDNDVATFSRYFAFTTASNSFIKKYNSVFDSYYSTFQNSLSNTLDRFLFYIEANAVYGFDFFKDVDCFLTTLKESTLPSTHNNGTLVLKDLEGTALLNIINSVSELPLYCNKFIFLKYAINAVTNNPFLDSAYLEENPKIVMSKQQITTSTISSLSKALELMENFFTLLGQETIPLLYTLWDYVFEATIAKDMKPDSVMQLLEHYIRTNYTQLLSSYSQLDESTIFQMGKHYVSQPNSSIASPSLLLNNNDSFPFVKLKAKGKAGKTYELLSTKSSDNLKYLVERFCLVEPLKHRFPLFFTEQNTHFIPVQDLVTSLIKPTPAIKSKQPHPDLARETFQQKHCSALNQYLFSSK